jgi:TM2 domain-containing membrane protein YozV
MATYHGDISQFSNVRFQRTRQKSLVVAYLLWWFFGVFGVHRFYMDRVTSGLIQLSILPLQLIFIFISSNLVILSLSLLAIWLLVDAVLLPFME